MHFQSISGCRGYAQSGELVKLVCICIYISISQDFKPLMYMMDLMLHFYLNFIEKSYSDIIML